jgi:hypothetical protein
LATSATSVFERVICFPQKEVAKMNKVEMLGQKFHRLLVLGEAPRKNKGHAMWECKCDCGTILVVDGTKLRNGSTKSCGCFRADSRRAPKGHGGSATHGMAETPEYGIWQAMKNRCFNANQEAYKKYGARGITVCNAWVSSFESFIGDMGLRPSASHSIDRIDTSGHYSCGHCDQCKEKGWPANCNWATQEIQHKNRRITLWVTHDGQTLTIKEWAAKTDIGYTTLRQRIIKSGWPIAVALTTPPDTTNRIK